MSYSLTFDTNPQPLDHMIDCRFETPSSGLPDFTNPRRRNGRFERQLGFVFRNHLHSAAGMTRGEFLEQAMALRIALAEKESASDRGISVVLGLPNNISFEEKLKTWPHRYRKCVFACNGGNLRNADMHSKLHAFLNVHDGSGVRIPLSELRDLSHEAIEARISPSIPLTASASVDMVTHFPKLFSQHGLVCSGTSIGKNAIAIWLKDGILFAGSTGGKCFQESRDHRWGIASYEEVVTLEGD